MDTIKDIIPHIIGRLSDGKTQSIDIVQEWQLLCGADTSSVVSLKEGCLTVNVDCSARAVQWNTRKQEFLQELNKKDFQIKNIRFKVGKL